MKRLLITLLVYWCLSGCIICEKNVCLSCPDQNVLYIDSAGNLQFIQKGYFDGEPGIGGNYITERQYNQILNEAMRKEGGL